MSFPLHRIGVDGGITFHDGFEDFVSPAALGDIKAYSLITAEEVKERTKDVIATYYERRRFAEGLKVKSFLTTFSKATFPNTWKKANGKVVLNGASGDRALVKFRRGMEDIEVADQVLIDEFKAAAVDVSSLAPGPRENRVFSIEIKNFFNFFHFITESLHQLTMVPSDATEVNLISRDEEPKAFVHKWLQQVFPELMDRIRIVHPRDVKEEVGKTTLTPIAGRHLLYQLKGAHIDFINERSPNLPKWQDYIASRQHISSLALNAVDSSMLAFRQRAYERADEENYTSDLSRIYIARKPGHSRSRPMEGEDKLFAVLRESGFVKVYLEDLDPLGQVALMRNAQCVIMQHGAGMANMIFGNPNTHVIEIGTGQTALRRWSYFIPLTNVSQCHYHAVFADMDYPEDAGLPAFDDEGLVSPTLDARSILKIADIVDNCLRETLPGPVAGLVHHAQRLKGQQPNAMLWQLVKA